MAPGPLRFAVCHQWMGAPGICTQIPDSPPGNQQSGGTAMRAEPQPLAQPINCPNSVVLKAALRHRKVQPCCRSALLLIFTFSAESQERLVTGCSWVASHQKEHAPETAGGLSLVGPGELLMKVRSPPRNTWKGIQGDFPGATCTSWARALGRLGTSPLHPESFSQDSFCQLRALIWVGLERAF